MTASFSYQPSPCVPFRDLAEIERCRAIRREDIEKHSNPLFRISVQPVDDITFTWIADMFQRVKNSDDEDQVTTLLLPNPCPDVYRKLAHLINLLRVDCRNLYVFALDEYANEEGVIAPENWPFGFVNSLMDSLYLQIDAPLRPPREQFIGPTNSNLDAYGTMIADLGGADACYTGPGWTGHIAFVEPDAPEFDAPLAEWKKLGPRICTLSPFTLAQNSLHGSFGMSGNLALVPPKAATIGPAEVIAAKNRFEFACLTVQGSAASWQRLIARLCYHGPVTPRLPSSLHQLLRTDCLISEEVAANIEPHWNVGY